MLGSKEITDFVISMAGIGVRGDTALTAQTNKILELSGQSMRISTQQYRMNAAKEKSSWLISLLIMIHLKISLRRFAQLWLLMEIMMFK